MLEHDESFSFEYREAEIEAVERLEEAAWRRAVEGVKSTRRLYDRNGQVIEEQVEVKFSDALLTLLLKAHKQEKYRERVDMRVEAQREIERLAEHYGLDPEVVADRAKQLSRAFANA